MVRIFVADSREHPDPDPNLSIEQVRDMMADFLPDLMAPPGPKTRGLTCIPRPVMKWTPSSTSSAESEPRGTDMTQPKFSLGRVVITAIAMSAINEAHGEERGKQLVQQVLARHNAGDWGEMSKDDIKSNNQGLQEGDRLFSSYEKEFGFKVWVITEHDRSYTTVMLPTDY